MNSSESEEDFESADEDIDLDRPNTLENKDDIKDNVKKSKHSENDQKKDYSLELTAEQISDKLEQVNFDEPVTSDSKGILKRNEASSENENKSTGFDTTRAKNMKIKTSVNKLGTKLSANETITRINENHSYSETENEKKNTEKKTKTMKLGTKLTSEVVKDPATIEKSTFEVSSARNELTKADKHPEPTESRNSKDAEIVPNTEKPNVEDRNFESGDGWELEEEDGFEIPVSLAKSGDGSIKCPQEQIFELDQVEFKPSKTDQEPGWGGWGGWGVSSLLSTATGTVTTFSSHVTAGLSTVLETTVGAPAPETLASQQVTASEPTKNDDQADPGYGGLGSLMSGVSSLGSSVINRGLDTLETIGKKTMEVLQEGDPGLKKKRAMLFQDQDKPILSQILREAKERADNSDKEKEEKEAARRVHFESLFDDFQGMVHLEALEMLSTQCELKLQLLLQSQSGAQLLDLQETLSQVGDLCELAEEEEDAEVLTAEQFAERITECVEALRIKVTPTKIIKVNNEICARLEQAAPQLATAVHQTAISSLAELTAAAMEAYHKSAELVMAKPCHNTADEADGYVRLTNHLCARVSAVANEFTQLLTKNDPIANSSLITNIFLEASNSCSYIKSACQLLVPILQVGAVAP